MPEKVQKKKGGKRNPEARTQRGKKGKRAGKRLWGY